MRIDQSSPSFYTMTRSLRTALDNVQEQIGTGQKASTYGAMGAQTAQWLNFATMQDRATAYVDGIDRQQLRMKLIDATLKGFSAPSETVKSVISGSVSAFAAGATVAQNAFSTMVDQLNSKHGSVPLFGGGALSGDVTLSARAMLDGDGTQPGLRALINERIAAETGGGTLGRLALSATASALTVTQNGGAFGLRLLGASSSNPALSVSGPSGTPVSLSLSGTGSLAAGDEIKVQIGLPDGATQTISVVAGETGFPAGPFNGSACAAILSEKISQLEPALKISAALQVTRDYFSGAVNPVSGTPATAAMAMAPALSIPWYLGQSAADPRQTVQALIGDGSVLKVGVQANESAFQSILAPVAAMVVLAGDTTLQNAAGQEAMKSAMLPLLSGQSLVPVQTEIGLMQKQLEDGKTAQGTMKKLADDFMVQHNRADPTELAAQLLTLQNQLQASYQAGANILKLSLVNYL